MVFLRISEPSTVVSGLTPGFICYDGDPSPKKLRMVLVDGYAQIYGKDASTWRHDDWMKSRPRWVFCSLKGVDDSFFFYFKRSFHHISALHFLTWHSSKRCVQIGWAFCRKHIFDSVRMGCLNFSFKQQIDFVKIFATASWLCCWC